MPFSIFPFKRSASSHSAGPIRFSALRSCLAVLLFWISGQAALYAQTNPAPAMQGGDVYYFCLGSPARMERFSLSSRTWLTPIPMNATATALWVDADGIYAAEGRPVVRWNLDGSNRKVLTTGSSSVLALATVDDALIYLTNILPVTLNKTTGAVIQADGTGTGGVGFSYDPGLKRLFHRSSPNSSARMLFLGIGTDGRILETYVKPISGADANASRTFFFPSAGRVADDSGRVYSADSLDPLATIGGAFTDLAFYGSDVPVVLRGDRLFAYTNTFLEAGRVALGTSAGQRVAVVGTEALVFRSDPANAHGLSILPVPLASLNAPGPGLPKDPSHLAFNIDDAFLDQSGVLHLLSKVQSAFFRWSTATRQWTGTLPLPGAPSRIAYAPDIDAVYCNYRSNRILLTQLGTPPFEEKFFASVKGDQGDMAALGDLLYTTKRAKFEVLSPQGNVLSSGRDSGGYTAAQCTWDPVRRRIYHYRDGNDGSSLYFEAFNTSGAQTSQFLGSSGMFNGKTPIRINADGSLIATGNGRIVGAGEMQSIAILPALIKDMIWQNNRLLSLEASGSSSLVQRWDATWKRTLAVALKGSPERLFALPEAQVLVVALSETGRPLFHILDQNLEPVFTSEASSPEILEQPAALRVNFGSAAVLRAVVKDSPGLSYQWFHGSDPIPDATAAVLTIPNAGSEKTGLYSLKVTNASGFVVTEPVPLSVGPVPAPLFTPGNLLVSFYPNILEYTPDGTLVRTLPLEYPPGVSSGLPMDLAVDPIGRLHVVTRGFVDAVPQSFISTYDSSTDTWRHVSAPGINSLEKPRTDLAVSGDWAITYAGLVNVVTGETRALPSGFVPDEIALGLNNIVYGVGPVIRSLTLTPPAWTSPVTLQGASVNGVIGLAVAADGKIFGVDPYGQVRAYSATGSVLKSLTVPAGTFGDVLDLSLSTTGKIAIGHARSSVSLTDSTLTSSRELVMELGGGTATFTAWMPEIVQPQAAFGSPGDIPTAVEDTAWSWTPAVTHPDPDAVLTVAAVQLPAWMRFAGGQLSGIPLQEHTGPNTLTLSVRNGDGPAIVQTFTLSVSEVNDAPAGTGLTLERLEDAAPESITLTALFTDEETPANELIFSILTPPSSVVTAGLSNDAVPALQITWLPDANGTATITIRATDSGGLFADAVITVITAPVNDPPVIPTALPDVAAGDSAEDVLLDFSSFATDPDAGDVLVWSIVENTNPGLFTELAFDSKGQLSVRYAPFVSGTSTVTVAVTDSAGSRAERSFTVSLPEIPAPSIVTSGALTLNRQTGLWEQRITVKNAGQRPIGGIELTIAGLPDGTTLYNASTVLSGGGKVGYNQPVAAGDTVALLLEYYSPTLHKPSPVVSATTALPQGAVLSAGDDISIDRAVMLKPGSFLLEFSAVPGGFYQVQYNMGNSWVDSMARVRAAGNKVQWIDQGPPRTPSAPAPGSPRLYRVKKLSIQ